MCPAESQGSEVVKEIRHLEQAVAVDISGDVDLHRSPALRETLAKLIDEDPGRLVLNLTDVGYMDSSGIATLVEALQRIQRKKGRLQMHSLKPRAKYKKRLSARRPGAFREIPSLSSLLFSLAEAFEECVSGGVELDHSGSKLLDHLLDVRIVHD